MKSKDTQKNSPGNWLLNLRGLFDPAARLGLILTVGGFAAAFCLWVFAEIAADLLEDKLAIFDARVTLWIHILANPHMTQVMKVVSNAGGDWFFLGLTGLGASFFLYRKQRHIWDAVIVQICLWGGFICNYGLKYLFKRERPSLERLVEAGGFSFPSGHSMVSFAFYGILLYLVFINMPRTLLRIALMFAIGCFIMLVGVSRIYLGVHYPSDVAAGFAAGGVWLAACIVALEAVRHYRGRRR